MHNNFGRLPLSGMPVLSRLAKHAKCMKEPNEPGAKMKPMVGEIAFDFSSPNKAFVLRPGEIGKARSGESARTVMFEIY